MEKLIMITLLVLMSVKANAQGGVGKFLTNYSVDGKEEIKTSSNIGFVRDGEADRYSWKIDWDSQNNNTAFDYNFDIKNVKSIFRYVESDNQLTVNLPSNINPNDVIVQAYGQEITPTNNHIYSTGASTVSVLNKDGKIIYESYLSIDTMDAQRAIEVNAMETAYSMLIPLFPFALDPTSDEILATLKSLLAELSETHTLAAAIEKSVAKNGYLEIDEVSSELYATANRIIEKLGLRDNYLKQSSKKAPSKKSSRFPTVIDGKRHFGLELNLDYSEWNTKEKRWQCHFTAYNSNRFAYTGWTKGYKDSEGYAHLYDIDYDLFKKRILKPQRVSTFMKNFTTWEGMKEYWSETYRLFTDADFGFEDMKWDNTKKSFDIEFSNENDVVVVLGPADDDLMLYYNFMKSILEAPAKKIAKKIFDAEDDDYMLNFCIDLLADEDFRMQFKMIYNDNLYSYGKKSVEIFKLAWPKFEKQLKEKFEDDMQFLGILYVWTRYGIKDALQLDNAFEEFSKNWNKWLKMVEFWGDLGLGILGLQEGNLYYNLDLNFDIEEIPVSKETFKVNGVKFDMVKVEGGTYQMGATDNDKDASSSEKPRHKVSVSNFCIGETEVTQALWKAVMGSNPSKFSGTELPVDNVSWLDCQEFITKLNEMTGKKFRLPTEAEWEYAARGGLYSLGYKYSGSHDLNTVGWYEENSEKGSHPVRWKKANELGLYDMSGNVFEWCQDFYDSNYYKQSPETDPCNEVVATLYKHVLRGGCWKWGASNCRVSSRSNNGRGVKSEIFGLRLAMDDSQSENLVENGDFSLGTEGFTSDYEFVSEMGSRALYEEGKYAVGTSPQNYHYGFIDHGDHTTGTGNMLIVNGHPDNSKYVWKKTFTVEKGKTYEFSAWFMSVSQGNSLNKEMIEYNINGETNLGAYDKSENDWERYYWRYTATKTETIEIKIRTMSSALGGNDFAIDDISFSIITSDNSQNGGTGSGSGTGGDSDGSGTGGGRYRN